MARPVLVIDDQPDILEVLAFYLERAGISVVTAANGSEALLLLRGGLRPGVILLDIMMPDMDGLQFCEALRAESIAPKVPIIVLSGALDGRRTASSMGAFAFIEKPVEPAVILEAIRPFAES